MFLKVFKPLDSMIMLEPTFFMLLNKINLTIFSHVSVFTHILFHFGECSNRGGQEVTQTEAGNDL